MPESFISNVNLLAKTLPVGGFQKVLDEITPILESLSIIIAVHDNRLNINAVKLNETNINTIVDIKDILTSLYTDRAKYASIYADKTTLDSIFADKATLDGLFAIKTKLDSIFADKTTLDSIFADKATLDGLFSIKTKLDSIFTNIDSIVLNANNMNDIKSASQNANDAIEAKDLALTYRNQAEQFKNQAQLIAGGNIASTNVQFSDLLTLETYRTNVTNALNAINAILSSDDTSLDQMQELVNFIKLNKTTLDTLGIGNIAGLQAALDEKAIKATTLSGYGITDAYTQAQVTNLIATAIAGIVNSSPAALDTLKELATALGNDANFATTMTNALALKAPLLSPSFTGTPSAPTPVDTDSSTRIATTAFVKALLASASQTVAGLIGIATNAEIQTGTEASKAITPAGLLSAFVNSKGNNGYTKLPNGLILQWGSVSGSTNLVTMSLPIAFPNACLCALATGNYGGSVYANSITSTSKTQLQGWCQYTLSYWFAIGY